MATRLQHRYFVAERHDAEAATLRDRGAAVTGPISIFLLDIDPTRLAMTASHPMLLGLREHVPPWQKMRADLASYGDGHPDVAVGRAADRASVAVTNAFTMGVMVVEAFVTPTGANQQRLLDTAKNDYWQASELLDLLRAGIRRDVEGASWPTRWRRSSDALRPLKRL
jgi:hypothetical protein